MLITNNNNLITLHNDDEELGSSLSFKIDGAPDYQEAYIKRSSSTTRSTFPRQKLPREQQREKKVCVKMADNKFMLVVLVLSLFANVILCQTFQYSRGWTNGKRSEFPNSMEISNPILESFTNGELKRLKTLLHGNADESPLLIHCDFMDKLRRLVHTDNLAPQLRREKGQNDDNY